MFTPGYMIPLMSHLCQSLRLRPPLPPTLWWTGILAALLSLVPQPGASCQSALTSPDSVAAEFQGALRAVAWRAAAARLHTEALADFHYRLSLLVEGDTTGASVERLYPERGLEAYREASQEEAFLRILEVLTEDALGLIHALVVRDVEIIGSVPEGPEVAHVVYRSTAILSGARPELRIMTMKREGDVWRVLTSQELDILVEAFRGVALGGGG